MGQSNDVRSVEKWGQTPLDLNDPQGRFRLSRWNYFHKDPESGLVMGQWECEEGIEPLDGTDPFDEMLTVIEGRIYVECGGKTTVAEPGDTVLVMRGRPTTISAKERTRVVFVCFPLREIEQYEAAIRQGMAQNAEEN